MPLLQPCHVQTSFVIYWFCVDSRCLLLSVVDLICGFVRKYMPSALAVWTFLPDVTFLSVASVVWLQVPKHTGGTGAIWEHGAADQAARKLPAEPAEDQSVPQPSWDGEGDKHSTKLWVTCLALAVVPAEYAAGISPGAAVMRQYHLCVFRGNIHYKNSEQPIRELQHY